MRANMKYIHKIFMIICIADIVWACQSEVDLPQLPYDAKVIIQGIMEPDSVAIVYFNRTVPYLEGTTDPARLVIRNASVIVSSSSESDQLYLDSVYLPLDCSYSYFYRGNIKAKHNTVYTLTINADGKTYTATTSTALTPAIIDSVSYTPAFKDLYGEHEGVITYFKDIAGEENYYRFQMTRKADVNSRDVTGNNRDLLVPCLDEGDTIMFTEIGRSVYSDKNLTGQQIKLIIEPALTHTTVVTIFVRIQTIDKATFEFYDQLDGQKLAQYNPFVEPVLIKDGQFGESAKGFFGSMVRSTAVKFEMPADD
jgi:hypothetical protein